MSALTRAVAALSLAPLAAQTSNPVAAVEAAITAEGLASHIRFLSHDLLEGRGVGSRGDELARLYVTTRLEALGLRPGGADGGWEQRVPIVGIRAEVTAPLTITAPGGASFALTAPDDYTAFAGRPDPATAWDGAEIVFVGYGIHAAEQDWDDFGDADLRGKVLLVMNNDPSTDDALFAGKTRLYYGRWTYKYEEAARRGAAGAIVIHTTPSAGYPFHVIQSGHGREQFWLPPEAGTPSLAIRSWCSEDAARRICAAGGHDLDRLRARAETRGFRPVALGVTASLHTTNTVTRLESANVVGVLPGRDPALADEHVVITAHFDHLGRGKPKGEDDIYNGALDNASGTAAMLAIAEACAALDPGPRRSLLFLAVTAEESGLLGSRYFALNPTVPRQRLVADFNLDGVNIWGATKDIEMIGYGKSSLTDLADEVARRRGRVLTPNQQVDLGLFYRSDHFSFARVGVPSAYFKAGSDFYERRDAKRRVKASYTAVRYHQPNDEFDGRWDLGGAVEDARLVLECLVRCANADEAPAWTPGDEFEKLR